MAFLLFGIGFAMCLCRTQDNRMKNPIRDGRMKKKNVLTAVTDASVRKEVLENPEPVLVEFGTEWCGTCHILAPVIEGVASEFEGRIKVCWLDMDANARTVQEYGIRDLPTLLFFRHGRIVDHLIGAASKAELAARLKALL